MDNSNDLTSSILQSNKGSSFFGSSGIDTSTGSSSSFFDMFKNMSGLTWLVIILILAFLGFNVFAYLAQGTQDITNFFNPILKKLFGVTLVVTSEVIDNTAEGAKVVVNTTANVLDKSLTAIQDLTPNPEAKEAPTNIPSQPVSKQQPDIMANNTLNKSLNTPQPSQGEDYYANEAESSINSAGKGGWCYIGEDQGYRVCAQVSASDKCMSGDIFPSQQICINPNLRP